ncbi:LexA/Signal peptidase [Dendrothele bispora CBS 962.96]|uniref:LexA/Signal peptidase n=1 Tax=Dendrothele bispora (strain CBS 962.96) TaxID=1314807 RepID=A0A4S8LYM7_DENBC|nr:LexA/Signal peptidase [Dendrothele bispora CBS 962.96]
MSRWIANALNALKDPNAVKFGLKRTGIRGFKLINMFCAIHLFTEYVGRPSTMAGPSMLPTLATYGEIVIEDRITYRLNPSSLSRGDLVTLKSPVNPSHIICKRVIGLPGDIVCVDPTGNKAPSSEHVVIPKGHIWISGDNAANSRDSRDYGPVPISLIQARLYARVWPLKDSTIFRNPTRIVE